MPDKALALYRAELKKLRAAVRRGEIALDDAHAQLARDVLAKLREGGKTRRTTAQLEQLFTAEFEKSFPKRVRIVRTAIKEGADAGPAAAQQTMRAVYGNEVLDAQLRATSGAMHEAADRIAGRITVDKVGLTKRMRRIDREIAGDMAKEVQRGVKQQRGILGAARKIEKLDPRSAELPKYLQELEAAARAGDKTEVARLAKSYAARIAKLGEVQTDGTFVASKYSLKSATKKFVEDVQKAGPKQLDKIVNRYIKEKLAYQANRIARSETVEAMRQSYVKQMADKPGVVCFQWTLSNRHASAMHAGGSRMDVCDILANANAYGLGPGRYPAAHVPKLPHPNCLPPGELIETSTGLVAIEHIAPGMLVRTHTGALRKVLRLSVRPWRGTLRHIAIGGRRLAATPEHLVLTPWRWRAIGALSVGDWAFVRLDVPQEPDTCKWIGRVSASLACAAAGHFALAQVTEVEREPYDGVVHNFAVDVDESYVASGVVTHNCLCTVHAVLDRSYFDRPASEEGQVPAEMQDHTSPDAAGWLKKNPDKARVILGPTRHALLEQGREVLEPSMQPKLVRTLVKSSGKATTAR